MELRIDPDNKIMCFFARTFDIVLLQILFILTSIPIFTVGASLSALFSTCRKLQKESVTSTAAAYFASFKECFKQSTLAWLIMLVVGAVVGVDIWYYHSQGISFNFPLLLAFVVGAVDYLIFLYFFPLTAWFDNTLKGHFRNSLMLSVLHFLTTVLVTIMYIITYNIGLVVFPLVVFMGFSGPAYLATYLFAIVFRKHGAPEAAPTRAKEEE
ncbi:MAG: YesL family protein [Lachnospiraceae bacterium]|nr:YesL family protein [Lachnospiraceae bacterium]